MSLNIFYILYKNKINKKYIQCPIKSLRMTKKNLEQTYHFHMTITGKLYI